MTDDDRQRFAGQMATLGEVFNEPVSEIRAAAYWDAFGDLGIDDVEAAVRDAISSAKFFPRPAEIRERAMLARWARRERLEGPANLGRAITDAMRAVAENREHAKSAQEWAAEYARFDPKVLATVWAEQDAARAAHRPKRRPALPGGNLYCPGCANMVDLREGTVMPWCNRCAAWLCSTACATKHQHASRTQ